jgi:dTDP-4-amino-4,6-dideoxyglucose
LKDSIEDLALFGGRPLLSRPVVVGRPNVGDRARFHRLLDEALDSGRLTHCGPLVREFERRVAEAAGVRHCVAMCNATLALSVLARAAGIAGEVIMPSLTYVATPHAMRFLGLRPVFCDVDPETGCLDPARVERLITPRTGAILGVHLWAQPCDADALQEIADRHGLPLFFDAAQALGSRHRGRPVGGLGRAEVFSFHATKVVNAFEGGAVVTDDERLAERVRAVHNFGKDATGLVGGVGTNAKMTEGAAAMGIVSLEALDDSIARNVRRHDRYAAELAGVPGLRLHRYGGPHANNHQYAIVRIDPEVAGVHRDLVLTALAAENVFAQPYFSPGCHQLEPYATENPVSLPVTERLADQVLALPTGQGVTDDEVVQISRILRMIVGNGAEVTRRSLRPAAATTS